MLWPALLPLVVYAVWCIWRYRRKQAGHAVPPVTKRLYVTIVATIVLAGICLVVFGAEQKPNAGHSYTPAQYKDGVLIPASRP